MARPTKLNPGIHTAMRELLETDDLMTVVYTDEELVSKLNYYVRPEDRISYRTYQRYKHYAMKYGITEVPEDIDNIYAELYRLIKQSLLQQKMVLMRNLMECELKEWHRYKWIMERKFKDFNIHYKEEPYIEDEEPFIEEKEKEKEPESAPKERGRTSSMGEALETGKEFVWVDYYGNVIQDWKPDMTPREDELPLKREDESRRVTRRYYEDFRGRTGDRPGYKDSHLKNYWPEGFEKPIVDENDTWWSDKNNPPSKPENSVRHHSIQSEERKQQEKGSYHQPSQGGEDFVMFSTNNINYPDEE